MKLKAVSDRAMTAAQTLRREDHVRDVLRADDASIAKDDVVHSRCATVAKTEKEFQLGRVAKLWTTKIPASP